ncbi:MAG: hypothetical protein KDC67_12740, partial [Ignavibacteriae bacterium]|nr:hypothetical protein [Ignavibacteriota bacterium]
MLLDLILLLLPTFRLIIKLFKSPKLNEIETSAAVIGHHFPEVKDRLINSIQLIKHKDESNSEELTNAAFLKTFKSVENLNFQKVINYSRLKYFLKLAGLAILTFAIFNTLNKDIRSASNRLLHFNTSFIKPNEFSLKLLPGNLEVKKNENLDIKILASGNPPKTIDVFTKDLFQSEFTSQNVILDSNNTYQLRLRNIKNSFSYFAGNDRVKTDTYQINVTSPPQISGLTIEIIPPNYSRLPKVIQNDNGNLNVLKGTKINFDLTSSKLLSKATIITSDSTNKEFEVTKNSAKGSLLIKKELEYYFEIYDSTNNKNENPIKYSIAMTPDNFPEIEVTNPKQYSLLPQNDLMSINYNIKDDFGFAKCLLKYNVSKEKDVFSDEDFKSINLSISNTELEQTLFYNWDLTKLFLKENEIVTFYLEIFDNDNINGPKATRSNIFKIRVPTLNELFAEVENTQDNAIDDLAKTMKDEKMLKTELAELQNELKQNEKKIDWNEKEKIEQAANKFEEVTKNIEEIKDKLEEMQNKMMQNNLLSEETMKKYDELQDLLDELTSDEMKKAMEEMQNSLKDMMRDKVQNSLDNLTENEKMFQKSIERTLNLLKKIQIEQKMEELIKRTENIVDNLDKQKEKTEN